jgi:hypothetical protein
MNIEKGNHLFRIVLVIFFFLTVSCASLDPYENFKSHLQAEVGENIDDAPSYSHRAQPNSISTNPLQNGNIEYHYEYKNFQGICRYVFEVDPKTRKIVDWRYDGEDKDKACFVNP